MSEEFRRYIVRLIFKIREKIKEVKDHFNKEAEIIKRNQTEILEMKETINQIKNSMESITNRLERQPQTMKKKYTLLKIKLTEKMLRNHEQNFQEIWDNMKRPNLRFTRIDKGVEIQTKGIHNLFNDIISENFPNLKNEMENQLQEV